MTKDEIRQFDRDGYLLVRDVFSAAQAAWLREFFLAKFDLPPEPLHGDTDSTVVDMFSRYPEIRWLLFSERTLRAFRALAGDDFVIMAECFAALNNYVNWHKDTTAWERRGHKTHWEKGYRMIGFMYYLQDNTEEYGGGLEVEPGSHLAARPVYCAAAGTLATTLASKAWIEDANPVAQSRRAESEQRLRPYEDGLRPQ